MEILYVYHNVHERVILLDADVITLKTQRVISKLTQGSSNEDYLIVVANQILWNQVISVAYSTRVRTQQRSNNVTMIYVS